MVGKGSSIPRNGSGRSAAWLARLPWEQEVAGSNPAAPTMYYDTALAKSVYKKSPGNFFAGAFSYYVVSNYIKRYSRPKATKVMSFSYSISKPVELSVKSSSSYQVWPRPKLI